MLPSVTINLNPEQLSDLFYDSPKEQLDLLWMKYRNFDSSPSGIEREKALLEDAKSFLGFWKMDKVDARELASDFEARS